MSGTHNARSVGADRGAVEQGGVLTADGELVAEGGRPSRQRTVGVDLEVTDREVVIAERPRETDSAVLIQLM